MRSINHLRSTLTYLLLLSIVLAGCAARRPQLDTDAPPAGTVYDAIVVGAGLAGLTTAKELLAAEHSVLVLEATGRIGGRAITDDRSFSIPIDLGGAWIHGSDTNPLSGVIDRLGLQRVPTDLDGPVFVGSRRLTDAELEEYGTDFERTEAAMAEAMEAGLDPPASDFLPLRPAYRALIAANIGPLESGAEISETSSADAAAFHADPDDFVREGVGTFVQRFGRDVPVTLNSPVTAIRYRGEVRVEVASGHTYRGRRVVVTVSTGVLAASRITFDPELPDWKWQAIRGLPMGLLNKVVFEFDGDVWANEKANQWVVHQQADPPSGAEPEIMAFVIKPLGANVAVGFYGGDQARRFEELGDQAAIDHARAVLAEMYGAEVASRIQEERTRVTRWGENPWTLGSYSAARPGASALHAKMAEPVDGLVFFAGEACGPPELNGSLAAAYVSGLEAARAVRASLAAEALGRTEVSATASKLATMRHLPDGE